jgi:hypothetical protein
MLSLEVRNRPAAYILEAEQEEEEEFSKSRNPHSHGCKTYILLYFALKRPKH